jgi:hypothetical protein
MKRSAWISGPKSADLASAIRKIAMRCGVEIEITAREKRLLSETIFFSVSGGSGEVELFVEHLKMDARRSE